MDMGEFREMEPKEEEEIGKISKTRKIMSNIKHSISMDLSCGWMGGERLIVASKCRINNETKSKRMCHYLLKSAAQVAKKKYMKGTLTSENEKRMEKDFEL